MSIRRSPVALKHHLLILVAALAQAPVAGLLLLVDRPVAAIVVGLSFAFVAALLVMAANRLERARAELATATQRLTDVTSQLAQASSQLRR